VNNLLVLLNRLETIEDYLSKIREIAKTHGIEKVYLTRISRAFGSRVRSRVAPHKLDMAAKMSDDAADRYLAKVADDLRKDGLDVEPIASGIPAKGIDAFIKKNNIDLIVSDDGHSELRCLSISNSTGIEH
jgi:nucleotide-binding universal stress UspA family protein